MDAFGRAYMKMVIKVAGVIAEYELADSNYVPIAATVVDFLASKLRMTDLYSILDPKTSGITGNKDALRLAAEKITSKWGITSMGYALTTSNLEMKAVLNYRASGLALMDELESVKIMRAVYKVLKDNKTVLTPYGITTPILANILKAINDFNDKITAPGQAIGSNKSNNELWDEEIPVMRLVLEIADTNMVYFEESDNKMFKDMINAMRIGKYTGRHTYLTINVRMGATLIGVPFAKVKDGKTGKIYTADANGDIIKIKLLAGLRIFTTSADGLHDVDTSYKVEAREENEMRVGM